MKTLPEHVVWTLGNVQKATEPAIDRALSWFYGEEERPFVQKMHFTRELLPVDAKIEAVLAGKPVKGVTTPADGIRLVRKAQELRDQIAYCQGQLDELEAAQAPLHAEYRRRGGWNRYFLALTDGADGHIHKSQQCQTCNREGKATRFGWLTDFSARSEESLTAEVGPNACTVCFPWAETIRAEADKATKAAKKAEREAVAAARAKAAEAKGIKDTDGSKLRDHHGYELRTLVAARQEAVEMMQKSERMWDEMVLAPIFAEHKYLRDFELFAELTKEDAATYRNTLNRLVNAIAAKEERFSNDVWLELYKKAQAKTKRDRKAILENSYRLITGLPDWRKYRAKCEAEGIAVYSPFKK